MKKKLVATLATIAMLLSLTGCSTPVTETETYKALKSRYTELKKQYTTLANKYSVSVKDTDNTPVIIGFAPIREETLRINDSVYRSRSAYCECLVYLKAGTYTVAYHPDQNLNQWVGPDITIFLYEGNLVGEIGAEDDHIARLTLQDEEYEGFLTIPKDGYYTVVFGTYYSDFGDDLNKFVSNFVIRLVRTTDTADTTTTTE